MPEDVQSVEGEVQARLRAGDAPGAATAAIQGYGPKVLQYLRSLLRDEADAGEAFSRFAERLWAGLPGYRGEASFQTWAFRLARNTALKLQDEAWRRQVRPFVTGEATALAEELRTRTVVRLERQRQALDELRRALPEEDRTLLILRVDQRLSWEEIAEVLGDEGPPLLANTLAQRYGRLMERLRELARERGLLE
jgi:RNA polymerase sigma-70 factor (ECF subfamily)